ncbi:TolC family protein [Snodgrassella communis]|uniref:TolC family protein n=1 Tax=Snodgrassella communis TaxID=2946699 RepID=UPI00286A44D6|nr:TolC family protein [Snodgrassella communis]WMY91170.1 TolC family protein [Snodgrassella communis]
MNKRWLPLLLAMGLMAGCSRTDIQVKSTVALAPQFDHIAAARGTVDISRWWQSWPDPVLNNLINSGLKNNRDLAKMKANMLSARASAAMVESDLSPQAGVESSGSFHRYNGANALKDLNLPGIGNTKDYLQMTGSPLGVNRSRWHGNTVQAGFTARWEPDVFGQKRSDADEMYYLSLSETERWHGAQMVLSSEIADNYLKMRAMQQRAKVGEHSVATLKQLQRYTVGRFRAGQVTAYDVREVAAKLAGMQAQIATYQAQADVYQRNIAVLIGQSPQGFTIAPATLDIFQHIPTAPAGQLPLDVITRRPDIRTQENIVKAMSAGLASAKADRLPRFFLNFLWQTGQIHLNNNTSYLKNVGGLFDAGMTIPVFTAGRIKHNIERADAQLQAAIAKYDNMILQALAEVDSAYQMQFSLYKQTQLMHQAQTQAASQASAAEKLFRYGNMTLDQSLRARLNAEDLDDKQIQGRLEMARNLVNLYKVLGGGWQVNDAQ